MPLPAGSRLPSSVAVAMILIGSAVTPARGADGSMAGMVQSPLQARSGPPGATMFTLMPAEATGIKIENAYADPGMWGERYQELVYGAIGCGAAIGDYDNDGRPDIFVVSKTGVSRLFRNLGGWKFGDVTEKAGLLRTAAGWTSALKSWIGLSGGAADDVAGAWKQGAVFVDVNNDGWLDLFVTRFRAPNWLFVNQGDGTFREEAGIRGLGFVDACGTAAFGDFDRDGWLDVYIQTNFFDAVAHPHGQRDFLFRNNRDGTFTNVTDSAGIDGETAGHAATWWDYDGDGWPDLYVDNDYEAPDFLYHNNRDGTFSNVIAEVVPHTPYYSMGADLGDVDNDGRIDLFVADMAPATHETDQRGMAGSRARSQVYAATVATPQYMRNALYLNTGMGRMLEAAYLTGLAATDWSWSPRLEDLDNDGRLDLHVTNGMTREYHNADLLARIMGVEDPAQPRRVVRASPVLEQANFAFRNRGDLQFENVSAAWGLDQVGVSFGSAFGDLDGDGDLDLVFTNYEAGATVLRNDCPDGHRGIVALRGTRSNRFGLGAVVRVTSAAGEQVRTLVAMRGYLSGSEPVAHFGFGADERIKQLAVTWPSGAVQSFADLPVDRRLTITEPVDAAAPTMAPEQPRLFAPLGNPSQLNLPSAPPVAAVETQPLLPLRAIAPGLGLMTGLLDSATNPPLTVPTNAGAVIPGDFDHDGRLDVFIGARVLAGHYPQPPRSALLANRGNTFEDVTDALAPGLHDIGMVTAARWTDVDGDGWVDLLITVDWGGVRYWHNDHGRRFDDYSAVAGFTTAGTGWWRSLAAADFNCDGRLDYVAGNVGLNTQYRASAERPALLFAGDFRGNGGTQLVEAYYEGDRLFPWRTRNDLGAQIPSVLRRFPKNDDYARATVEDILGADRLAAAQRFAATELRSGVFLSAADGTYRFEALPRLAQIAPIEDAIAGDFDGDGLADIIAVQNSFAPIQLVGRFDGGVGQFLRGDGHGHFTAVPATESGIVVPGEGVAINTADFDGNGWPDFAVLRRGAAPLAFRNQGLPGRQSLRVVLQGSQGNPSAVGGRVILQLADGTMELGEVSAGSGCFSQASTACFFGFFANNPPREARVRWPSGSSTSHALPANVTSLVLTAPGP